MVRWLVYPTERGRVPDEIQLGAVVAADPETYGGAADFYVFNFRTLEPHWSAKKGWMAGVSGPFLQKDAPSPVPLGGTFSTFTAWDAKSPADHVRVNQDHLDEAALQRAKRAGDIP